MVGARCSQEAGLMESPDRLDKDCERRRSRGQPQGFSADVEEGEGHCLP